MMFKHRFFKPGILLIVFFAAVILITSCSVKVGEKTACETDSLLIPGNLTPNDIVMDASKPISLSWIYPDPSCKPDHYEVTLGMDLEGGSPAVSQTTTGTSFIWSGTLKPGKTYFWSVAPVVVSNGETHKGSGQFGTFYTGPVCAPGTKLLAPLLIYPPDNSIVNPTNGFPLRWDDPTGCLPDGDYYLVIAKSADFSSVVYSDRRGYMTELEMYPAWAGSAEDCTRYYWHVMADLAGSQDGPLSETWSFIVNKTANTCPLSAIPPTTGPTPTPLPPIITPTATPSSLPIAKAKEDVHCRQGPGPAYYSVGVLFKNYWNYILGRNEDSTWWYIHNPNYPTDSYCWISGKSVIVTGDTSQVPIVQPPPLQTSTPEQPEPTPTPEPR